MGNLNRDNIIGFVITEIDYIKKCLYTVEISYKPKYATKIKLLDMSFYYQWEELLNVDMYELKKHLTDNCGLHRKIGPSRITCWDNRESAQKAMEYLGSLVVMQKLCS